MSPLQKFVGIVKIQYILQRRIKEYNYSLYLIGIIDICFLLGFIGWTYDGGIGGGNIFLFFLLIVNLISLPLAYFSLKGKMVLGNLKKYILLKQELEDFGSDFLEKIILDEKSSGIDPISTNEITQKIFKISEAYTLIAKCLNIFIHTHVGIIMDSSKETDGEIEKFILSEALWLQKYTIIFMQNLEKWMVLHERELRNEQDKISNSENNSIQLASSRLTVQITQLEQLRGKI